MKAYYKTVLKGEVGHPEYPHNEKPDDVYEYKLLEMGDPCCLAMKEALEADAIGFGEVHDCILNQNHNINFFDCSPYSEGAVWDEYKINFCPFCGQKVETEEREKVSLKTVTRRHRITSTEHEEVPVEK